MAAQQLDVLIVGAGPTGLFLAYLLARQGIHIRIIDTSVERAKESRAIAIQARTLEIFQSVGLVESFVEQGLAGAGVSLFVCGKQVAELDFSDIGRDDTPYPYVLFLSQSQTEAILETALNALGVQVERQTQLITYEQQNATIRAQISQAAGAHENITARYLVGCDGAKSQIRKSLGFPFEGGTYQADFMLADAKLNWSLPTDRLMLFMGQDDAAIIMPLRGSALSRVITIGQKKPELATTHDPLATRLPATTAEVEQSLQAASETAVQLSDVAWVTRYRVHHRSVNRMRDQRVFLAGDAAHIHSPAGGQGMNTGLQDAANLAWKLAAVLQQAAPESLLETYESERLPVAKKLLAFTDRLFRAATVHNRFLLKIRNIMLPIVGKVLLSRRFVRRRLYGFISQLNIHYHASAVAQDIRLQPSPKLSAGMRAPDAPLTQGGSLFDLLAGYENHVLVLSQQMLDATAQQKLIDHWQGSPNCVCPSAKFIFISAAQSPTALQRYDVKNALLLHIRPDGYIGYLADDLKI